ncbi:autotransporter outer membrane beta-barrel domain-containing protein [Rickettsiales bacterium LUAb2]
MLKYLVIIMFIIVTFLSNSIFADFNSGEIDSDTDFSNQVLDLTHTLNISNGANVKFSNNSTLTIESNMVVNNTGTGAKPIIIDTSSINLLDGATINSIVDLQSSNLTSINGSITQLDVSGKSTMLVKGTKFDTINFLKTLGTVADKTTGLENVNITHLNVDFTDMQNDVTRIINFKGATIENFDITGSIDKTQVVDKDHPVQALTTNYKILDSTITNVNYTDSALTARSYKDKDLGEVNFSNTKITNLNVSFKLLRNLTFNGGEITNLKIVDTIPAPPILVQPSSNNNTVTSNADDPPPSPVPPTLPDHSNLQLLGTGQLIIDNFDLGNEASINIEGDAVNSVDNGSLSNLYIKNITNYSNSKISLYDLKNVVFGTRPKALDDYYNSSNGNTNTDNNCKNTNASDPNAPCNLPGFDPDDNNNFNPDKPDEYDKYLPEKSTPGGSNSALDINYLYKVTNLSLYSQRVKFDIPLDPVTNNVTLYQVNSLKLFNSLIDNSGTAASKYDLDIEKTGFVVFYLFNSGVTNGDTLRLNIGNTVNSQFTAYDMTSNLSMNLNGEKNIFILRSNSNNKTYTFNTNFSYCYLKSVDGKLPPNCSFIQYNYWQMAENNRLEQNLYYFDTDTIIAPLDGSAKNNKGQSVTGNVWFTYSQPLDDQCAKDQGTDGTGRGGFSCEFGNKIEVDGGTTSFYKALDNLTVLEIAGAGKVNFADIDPDEVSDTWISKLRLRGGTLALGTNTLYVDKLEMYAFNNNNTSLLQVNLTDDVNPSSGKIVVNQDANFHNNYLKFDLYFNKQFTSLNQKITLDILDLGTFVGPDPNGTPDSSGNVPNITQQATLEEFGGVQFAQGIMFDTDYYWKDNKLYVDITRVRDFSYWIKGQDKQSAYIFDSIINNPNYQINIDDNSHTQSINNTGSLNDYTIKVINQLFKAQSSEELQNDFISMRPINNQFLMTIATINTDNIINLFNAKNYLSNIPNQKVHTWANAGLGSNIINDSDNNIGSSVSTTAYVVGGDLDLTDDLTFGGVLGYAGADFDSSYYEGTNSSLTGGVYSQVNLSNDYYLNLIGIVSSLNYKGSRSQYFLGEESNYKINGIDTRVNMQYGKTININYGFIKPYVTGRIGYINVNNYQEASGSSAALRVDGFNNMYYNLGLGINYNKYIKTNLNTYVVPSFGIEYTFNYYAIGNTKASFININGITSDQNVMEYSPLNKYDNNLQINAGLNYLFNKNSSVMFNFQANLLSNITTGFLMSVGYKYSF